MNNVVTFDSSKLPAFARKAELSPLAKALAGGTAATGKRISIKGGVFRLIVDGKEVTAIDERHLDVVIVAAAPKIGRTFYLKPYDSETPTGPDCWSADGEKPDATSSDKQSTNCASCPQNAKGSGQGETKACRYSQRLAVVLANDVEGDVLQLQLPAQSLFGKEEGDNRPLQAYARFLAAQSCSPEMVVTRMRFDTKAESPKLFFKAQRWLTDEEYAVALQQGTTVDAKNAVTMTVAAMDKVASPPPISLVGKAPKKAEVPDAEEAAPKAAKPKDEEEDEPVPAVRKGKESAAPAAKATLAALAAQWDDE